MNIKSYLKKHILTVYKTSIQNIYILLKWLILSSIVGIIIGAIVTFFKHIINSVGIIRENNPFLLFLLPIAGIIIVASYRLLGMKTDPGINIVISSIRQRKLDSINQLQTNISPKKKKTSTNSLSATEKDLEKKVPLKLAPLIMLATTLTHLCGGSAGRTGAALQIGGSTASCLATMFKLNTNDKKILVMSGVSAGFAAILGTPISATIFSMEVVCVGSMHYFALVPCLFSSLIAALSAHTLGVKPDVFSLVETIDFNLITVLKTVLIGIICALVSMLFCFCLHTFPKIYERFFKNPYIRIVIGSIIIILINLLLQTNKYQGLGRDLILNSIDGSTKPYDFIIKLILTALTISCGFKGGEIMPSLVIGSTLGCTLGFLLGISPSLCAALGLAGLFCGATNCPITSILLSFELFGYQSVPFFLIVITISYMMSGYNSIYREQTILYNKLNELDD